MSVQELWLNGKVSDIDILKETNKINGVKRGKNLIIFTGSYFLQHFDYMPILDRPDFESIGMNYTYLIPGAEKFTAMFHGSMAAVKAYQDSTTFRYFCNAFNGYHIFMMQTSLTTGGPYGICGKADVIKTIKANNIKRFSIVTHSHPKKGLAWVPDSLNQYNTGEIPFGCSGSLNAMVLPMVLKYGYNNIYIVGIGDTNLVHFYDVEWSQVQLRKPRINPYRDLSLTRYRKLNALASKSGTKIIVIPGRLVEKSIRDIFAVADHI